MKAEIMALWCQGTRFCLPMMIMKTTSLWNCLEPIILTFKNTLLRGHTPTYSTYRKVVHLRTSIKKPWIWSRMITSLQRTQFSLIWIAESRKTLIMDVIATICSQISPRRSKKWQNRRRGLAELEGVSNEYSGNNRWEEILPVCFWTNWHRISCPYRAALEKERQVKRIRKHPAS